MNRPAPLTQRAQQAVAAVVAASDRAIDATMGNGHDTVFLARQVAPDGEVAAFDIQTAALHETQQRLDEAGLLSLAHLYHCGHEHMLQQLPDDWRGRVSAVMFNLGYLPGSDKTIITQATSTIAALHQALALLRPGGLLSVLLYRDHAGAGSESDAVTRWFQDLSPDHRLQVLESPGPALFLARKPAET
jgi:predicted methyltransferase